MKAAIALCVCCLAAMAAPASGMEAFVNSAVITSFKGAGIGDRVDGLIWRGGLRMESQAPEFGGLSGIAFLSPDYHLAMVSDAGNFVSGQLIYNEAGSPLALADVEIHAIQNSRGNDLPTHYTRDSEAIYARVRPNGAQVVRVGFENLTRVADFDVVNNRPAGAAREVPIPKWISDLHTNQTLESVCIAPNASPVAGSTLLITEGAITPEGHTAAHMLGRRDRGDLSLTKSGDLHPTDCAFLPNGDLLVLERGTTLLSFVMQLRRIARDDVQPGNVMQGKVILTAAGGDIDNMEGLAVHQGPGGDTRITIVSDDNFNDWERSLLLEFSLPD